MKKGERGKEGVNMDENEGEMKKNLPDLYNVKEYLLISSNPDFVIGQFFRANEFHKINFQVHFGGRFVLK